MTTIVTCSLPETKPFAATVAEGIEVRVGMAYVVEFNGGPELCRVRSIQDKASSDMGPKTVPGHVIRMATQEDRQRHELNQTLAQEALKQFNEAVAEAPQNVHAILTRFNLDRSRLVIIYHADQRFDTRRLAANLYRRFRASVEARQVGIRDEAAVIGGVGSCGRPICCATWLRKFQPVNVRMAKAQGLSLNPNAINGTCGRLKCCLRYESETPKAPKNSANGEADA